MTKRDFHESLADFVLASLNKACFWGLGNPNQPPTPSQRKAYRTIRKTFIERLENYLQTQPGLSGGVFDPDLFRRAIKKPGVGKRSEGDHFLNTRN